jgi:hypothetical protein
MREAGRLGGRASVRKRLGIDGDAELRERARRRLLEAIGSSDEKLALAASRAISPMARRSRRARAPAPAGSRTIERER